MSRNKDPELIKRADMFLEKYVAQGKKDVESAAISIRPEMKAESARVWGQKVLADPEARKRLHQIEQGAIVRIYDLADEAINRLSKLISDDSTPKAIQAKLIDIILRRVLGAVPDTVILAKFSMFDNEDTRMSLRDKIKEQMKDATYERVVDAEVVKNG